MQRDGNDHEGKDNDHKGLLLPKGGPRSLKGEDVGARLVQNKCWKDKSGKRIDNSTDSVHGKPVYAHLVLIVSC